MGEAWDKYMEAIRAQPKLKSFAFDFWIEKLELYVHERFEGREAGL